MPRMQVDLTDDLNDQVEVRGRLARTGSAVDALVVAVVEHGGPASTADPCDLQALAVHASRAHVDRV